jgi:hypothetical protein
VIGHVAEEGIYQYCLENGLLGEAVQWWAMRQLLLPAKNMRSQDCYCVSVWSNKKTVSEMH